MSASFPTYITYVIDSERCESPSTFTSTMLYCCSVLYKSNLPLIIVLNKNDVSDTDQLEEWMKDYDAYVDASMTREPSDSYSATLSRSCALAMIMFYDAIPSFSVSSLLGNGLHELLNDGIKNLLEDAVKGRQQRNEHMKKMQIETDNNQIKELKEVFHTS